MKDQNLQLLIHAKDVADTDPAINYPGVVIHKANLTENKNYLFLDLYISSTAKPGPFNIYFVKDNDTLFTHKYTLLARQKDAPIQGFTSKDVIYLLNPDRFANGDYTNDAFKTMFEQKMDRKAEFARHGGDLKGMTDHLDYIAKMGFTAIWPTPLLENNMPSYSYHGYAITNHYKVDPRFGTLDDYKAFAKAAREKGIKLIFDEVLNHTGTNYWWMSDLPSKDWVNKVDSFYQTNHRRTVNQDLYASNYDKDLWTNGWFTKSMPDLNGQNPFLATYLIQNTIWWIETLRLSGIRQDTYGYSDKEFLKKWSCRVMEEYPELTIVGEEWSYNPAVTSYWQKGKVNHDGYTSCLSTIMDFSMQSALVKALKNSDTTKYTDGLNELYETLANDFIYPDPKNVMVFGDNHDMDRLYTQLGKDLALTKMAVAYLLTIRGIPQIYYGTEVLLDNTGFPKNDGKIRADFPGGWKEDPVNAFNGKGLTADQKDMMTYMTQLLNWRKNNPVIADGQTLHFAPFNGVYVYFRYNNEGKTVMVIINKNEKETVIDTQRFAEIMGGKTKANNAITGEMITNLSTLTVKPESTTILSLL
jgi:glycosidase